MKEQFEKEIHGLAQQIKGLHDMAVAVYTPLVDDICSRVAPMKDVGWLLDYMFGFAGDERMLLLYRRVREGYNLITFVNLAKQISSWTAGSRSILMLPGCCGRVIGVMSL
jgi:hypothetical protein